jgi:hypothetical protein
VCDIFYNKTVNAARYVNNILTPLFAKLRRKEGRKEGRHLPAGFCNSSYGTCKSGSTMGGF